MQEEREEKARRSEGEAETLCRELRYAQQTVAAELAGWREMHERLGRKAIRDLAKGMVVAEKMRLEGLLRALRLVREGNGVGAGPGAAMSLAAIASKPPSPPPPAHSAPSTTTATTATNSGGVGGATSASASASASARDERAFLSFVYVDEADTS